MHSRARTKFAALRNRHRVPGQQVRALHAGGAPDVRSSCDERPRIAENIGRVPTHYGWWMRRPHRDAGLVDHDQAPVLASSDTGTVEVRVGVVRDKDTLALAARDNEVRSRCEGTASGD